MDLFDKASDKHMDKSFDSKDPTIAQLREVADPDEQAMLDALIAKLDEHEPDTKAGDAKEDKGDPADLGE